MNDSVGMAMIGCGYVADYYMATLNAYPNLKLQGVFDSNNDRLDQFCKYYKVHGYQSVNSLLADGEVQIVLNLTDPRSHFEVSRLCLQAGKNVYSEKPLAMNFEDAKELVDLAKNQGLEICSAPCSVLGKAARTLSYAVKQNLVGDIRLVYAELDDGMLHQMPYQKWTSVSGAPWPYRDEFEVGCTLEHAGYYLAWLLELFGPVESVTAFSDSLIPNKVPGEVPLNPDNTADVSIGILKFENGVVVRLTTTIVAPQDHGIRLFGDKGVLTLKDCWDNESKLYCQKFVRIRRKRFLNPIKTQVKFPDFVRVNRVNRGSTRMDFLLGVNSLALALTGADQNLLNADFSLHMNEVALALQFSGSHCTTYVTKSRF